MGRAEIALATPVFAVRAHFSSGLAVHETHGVRVGVRQRRDGSHVALGNASLTSRTSEPPDVV